MRTTMTYFPLPYTENVQSRMFGIVKENKPVVTFDIDKCFQDQEFQKHFDEMNANGWSLFSVSPVLRGYVYSAYKERIEYPLTDGFMLFWTTERQ